MSDRLLGSTGLRIGPVAFGAGPISQLLVGGQSDVQLETVRCAVERGVDWFDTAATYGGGESEINLGRALEELGLQSQVRVATKVRIMPEELGDIAGAARRSIEGSLRRLCLPRVTLLQVHNSITHRAGAEPTSITPAHVLGPGGLLEQMDAMRRQGLIEHLGLTGLGEPSALREVIASGAFATMQVPYNLLNASAGHDAPPGFAQTDYGNVIADCHARGMGVFAIRVFAGGALVGRPPSPHTFKTPFFPLDLYRQDEARAKKLAALLPPGMSRDEAAVRFVVSHPAVASAIIGFATPEEVARAVGFAYRGALDADLLTRLTEFSWRT
jgi:aryl-alcohol dehydrogenase-like predicted oxidoreductase